MVLTHATTFKTYDVRSAGTEWSCYSQEVLGLVKPMKKVSRIMVAKSWRIAETGSLLLMGIQLGKQSSGEGG